MADCACAETFRVYACDLATGRVRAILHPTSMEWENRLDDFGTGSLSFPTADLRMRDVWPDLTSIYIARIAGDGASPSNPIAEWAGMPETVEPAFGETKIGMQCLENYLNRRNIKDNLRFDQVNQNQIAVDLVQYARDRNGIPLDAEADGSSWNRDRTYWGYNRKLIGEALSDLSQVIEGPDWELRHTFEDGHWSTRMIFRDYVGTDRNITFRSNYEAAEYSLVVDARDHATWIDAIGSGEEEDMLIRTARDSSGIYPQFDAAPAWKDVTRESTLLEHAQGYLEDYQEPTATPQVVLKGLDVSPLEVRLGDTVGLDINYGVSTYRGLARIIGMSWGARPDAAVSRTLELLPLTRASESVLNQKPEDICPGGC